ncbi:MAG: ribonuclease Y [Chloroflexi bacterium]|nr:ribonuclease Y [Chloroflexota bacterium]MCI0848681.1 ribonuclease Y [Chloroflexota bacterium]MCI0900535.1 ribonuclease Y [Chloroflexota bacterium]
MEIIIAILAVLAAAGIGVATWFALKSRNDASQAQTAGESAKGIVTQAEEEKRILLLAAQEEVLKLRNATESDLKDQRQEFHRMESRHLQREEQLERKVESQEERERELASQETEVERARKEAEELKAEQSRALEKVAGLSIDEAREQVVRRGEEEAVHDLSKRYYELEKEYKEKSTVNARKIITVAINRLATDVVSEVTTSTVSLPNDEMKGRLIGREGRNIRTLEALTGVDVIIDDTPESVTVSCFDPVRREVARLALEKLVSDGRIQPARIEDMVNRAQEEIDQVILKAGEQATFDAGVSGLDSELIRLLGQLKFRYSYGENVLQHSIEVSLLSGMLAAEAGANVQVAKMGGLLHDIGKAVTHEVSGPHAEIGAEIARKHGINHSSYRGILEHHSDDHETVESFLVATADAISASRPGARRESLELYVKRLKELEEIATSFNGVERVFAIQAGREVRVMVKPEDLSDLEAATLARNIVKKVEEDLVFPGQIKVTVIRETRNVEYAK